MGALTGPVGTAFFLHTASLLSQLAEATLCTNLPYAGQIWHLCPGEDHRGVFAYRGGGNVVFERSLSAISPNGLLFVLHQKKNKTNQTKPTKILEQLSRSFQKMATAK